MLRDVYLAVVTNNKDPERTGAVKVKCPALVRGQEYPEWVPPALPYAGPAGSGARAVFVPEVGSTVELEMDAPVYGDSGVSGLPRARYRACFAPEGEKVPDPFGTKKKDSHYPLVAGFSFPGGAFLNFDFHSEGKEITLAQSARVGLVLSENPKTGPAAALHGGKTLVLSARESAGEVLVEAAGKVLLGSASAAEPVLLGSTYGDAEQSVMDALRDLVEELKSVMNALSSEPYLVPTKAALPTALAAAVVASTKLQSFVSAYNSYKSSKVKTE